MVATGLHQDELDKLKAEISAAGGQAIIERCDVRADVDVRHAVERALATYGRVDILVNNAGVTLGGDVRLLSDEEWERVLNVNLWGAIRTIRAVLPHMFEQKGGYIVNVASAAGLVAPALWIPYAVSKFAVVGLSEGLCAAVRPKGIGVSVVCPMWVQTDILQGPPPNLFASSARRTPAERRLGRIFGWLLQQFPGREMTAERVALRILRAIERERLFVYTHRGTRLIMLARAVAPEIFSRTWDRINVLDEARHRALRSN